MHSTTKALNHLQLFCIVHFVGVWRYIEVVQRKRSSSLRTVIAHRAFKIKLVNCLTADSSMLILVESYSGFESS